MSTCFLWQKEQEERKWQTTNGKTKAKRTREFGEREFNLRQHGSSSKDFTDGQQINILR